MKRAFILLKLAQAGELYLALLTNQNARKNNNHEGDLYYYYYYFGIQLIFYTVAKEFRVFWSVSF